MLDHFEGDRLPGALREEMAIRAANAADSTSTTEKKAHADAPIKFEGGKFLVYQVVETQNKNGQTVRVVRIRFEDIRAETRSVDVKIWPEDRTENRHIGFSSRGEFVDTNYSFPLSALKLALEQLELPSPDQEGAPTVRTSADILDEEGPE